MKYYRDTVTDRSWQLLTTLRRQWSFTLIGGWAVWLYTKQLKSNDIDIIIELSLLPELKSRWELVKNDRLTKYEFKESGVDVDVYVPYFSSPGGIPAEEIQQHISSVEGFTVPTRELLVATKVVTWASRRGSAKGQKDFLDIVSLLSANIKKRELASWLERDSVKATRQRLVDQIQATPSIPELGLNQHQTARAKKRWLQLVTKQGPTG